MTSIKSVGGRVSSVVLDPAIIAVMSASLIAPFFVPRINGVLDSVPILRDHKSLASLIAGIIVFGVAKMPRIPTFLSAVIVGIAGAFTLSGGGFESSEVLSVALRCNDSRSESGVQDVQVAGLSVNKSGAFSLETAVPENVMWGQSDYNPCTAGVYTVVVNGGFGSRATAVVVVTAAK